MPREKQIFYKSKKKLISLFKSDGRYLKILDDKGLCVVLSDLHNDGSTLKLIIDMYFSNSKDNKIVVCGDYVDRSPSSWILKPAATIDYLLELKLKYPDRVFLLMGNHDLNPEKYKKLMPCEFWYSLSKKDENFYTEILEALSVVAITKNGVIMTHGILPSSPAFFDKFDLDITELMETLWSDYTEDFPIKMEAIRKQKGLDDFRRSMDAFSSNVLIKGHNPHAPLKMFENKCVTLNTTRVYDNACGRHIAIIDLGKTVNSADDITIVNLTRLPEGVLSKDAEQT